MGPSCCRSDLCRVAPAGDREGVHHLLASGDDANAVDEQLLTPLHRAAAGGHGAAAQLLLVSNAPVAAVALQRGLTASTSRSR